MEREGGGGGRERARESKRERGLDAQSDQEAQNDRKMEVRGGVESTLP